MLKRVVQLVFRRAHRLCLLVLRDWKECTRFALHVRHLQMKALDRMHTASCSRSFDKWARAVAEAVEYERSLLATAMDGLKIFTKEEKAFKARLRTSVWR